MIEVVALTCIVLVTMSLVYFLHRGYEQDVAAREARFGRERELYLQRIGDLENRLLSHDWQTYANLQNTVMGPAERQAQVLQALTERAHEDGQNTDSVIEDFLAKQGVFTDGSVIAS